MIRTGMLILIFLFSFATAQYEDSLNSEGGGGESSSKPTIPSHQPPPPNNKPPKCGRNEELTHCAPCDKTCDNRNPVCSQLCKIGYFCRCKDRYVRNTAKQCISPAYCSLVYPLPHLCPRPNEEYSACGSRCQKTCENYDKEIPCILLCVPGCVCKKGYVRNHDNCCVCIKDCPVCLKPHEEYLSCGSKCPKTCDNYDKQIKCIAGCVAGCFCKEGYVKNHNNLCVRANNCPGHKCPKNEVYSDCVIPCNGCEIRGKCQFLVCNKGCDCMKGYYGNKDGECIPEHECPGTHAEKHHHHHHHHNLDE